MDFYVILGLDEDSRWTSQIGTVFNYGQENKLNKKSNSGTWLTIFGHSWSKSRALLSNTKSVSFQ